VRILEASIVFTEKNGDHVLQVREDYIFSLQIPQVRGLNLLEQVHQVV
jgi:hypothetical protein